MAPTRHVSVEALRAAMQSSAAPRVLDVRRSPAYSQSGEQMAGASWRDPAEVDLWSKDLLPGRPVVVYCVHGHEVSQGCADHLQAQGVDAHYLEGGLEAWKQAGGPTEAKPAPSS